MLSGSRFALRKTRGQPEQRRSLHHRHLLSQSQLGRADEWRSLAVSFANQNFYVYVLSTVNLFQQNLPGGLQRPGGRHRTHLRPDSVLLVGSAEPARGAAVSSDALRHHPVVSGRGGAGIGPVTVPAGLRRHTVQCVSPPGGSIVRDASPRW